MNRLDTATKKAEWSEYMREYNRKNADRINARRREKYANNPQPVLARNRIWRKRNRGKVQAGNHAYYPKHSDRIRQRSATWYAANPERARAKSAKWNAANAEKMRDYWAAYYEARKEKYAAYWQANKARFALRNRNTQHLRRSRRRVAAIVSFTMEQLEQRLSVFGHRCWMCGTRADHIDHVIALSRGGMHVLANLRPACGRCNRRKGSKDWRRVERRIA